MQADLNLPELAPALSFQSTEKPIVVVGMGPVGIRVTEELLRLEPGRPIIIYGDEPWDPYDRVKLSSLLAGTASWSSLFNPLPKTAGETLIERQQCPIVKIDRQSKVVVDGQGFEQPYAVLVLATGSRPHIPNIPGTNLSGVHTFRDMSDTMGLMARRLRSRRVVILGGGLLGLEAAQAMLRFNTRVTLVQHSNRLMNRQLDEESSFMLQSYVESLGVEILLGNRIQEIQGRDRVTGILLKDGAQLPCDTVILATGITPNTKLALESGLPIGRGILVDQHMRTSDESIYAIGECAEFDGRVYGLVAPGFEQAAVAAHCIADQGIASQEVIYKGSTTVSSLKVAGFAVHSMGKTADEEQLSEYKRISYRDISAGIYRCLIIHQRKIIGAIGVGEWPEAGRIHEAILQGRKFWPWQLKGFISHGSPWGAGTQDNVAAWPAGAVICNCKSITRGTLSHAISEGCNTLESLIEQTGASTVCGSCKPRMEGLIGTTTSAKTNLISKPLLVTSAMALFFAMLVPILPAWPFSDSVQGGFHLDQIWVDIFWKQVTGFSLLGLTTIGLLMLTLRKRISKFTWGSFSSWRMVHVVIGILLLAVLASHTGLHLGMHLNFALMSAFLAAMLTGALSGAMTSLEQKIGGRAGITLRYWWTKLHLWVFWPLPVLLAFHILKVYYF